MMPSEVERRLTEPLRWVGIEELAQSLDFIDVEALLPGLGPVLADGRVLSRVRGAVGDALKDGACEAVQREEACQCSTVCAADLFFAEKPKVRTGSFAGEITKPFVLFAEPARALDLLVVLRVFGFAQERANEIRLAFGDALRNRVNWSRFDTGHRFVPKRPEVARITLRRGQLVQRPMPLSVGLSFLSPTAADRGNPFRKPHRILERLIRRTILIARWYDCGLDLGSEALSGGWTGVNFATELNEDRGSIARFSNRTGRQWHHATVKCNATISGNLTAFWPFLQIGEVTHVGRGATIGLGRYTLISDSRS